MARHVYTAEATTMLLFLNPHTLMSRFVNSVTVRNSGFRGCADFRPMWDHHSSTVLRHVDVVT